MADPAPLITITDPHHPAPVHDVVDPEPAPHWSWHVRGLALALLLLLGVGLAAAGDLRARQRLQQHAEGVSVVVHIDASAPTRLSGLDRLAITVAFQATDRADLLRITAGRGWVPVGARDLPLLGHTDGVVELEHTIDCETPVLAPESVSAVLRVAGTEDRHVVLPLAPLSSTQELQAFACGEVDASGAVRLVASEVLRLNEKSTVTARLSNVSTALVTIRSIAFPGGGFSLPSSSLPLALPARARGLLVEEELPTQSLVLDAQVLECGTARAALDAAGQSGLPDILLFSVDGSGGLFEVALRVPGVKTYLEAEWASTCGG